MPGGYSMLFTLQTNITTSFHPNNSPSAFSNILAERLVNLHTLHNPACFFLALRVPHCEHFILPPICSHLLCRRLSRYVRTNPFGNPLHHLERGPLWLLLQRDS